MPWNKKGVSGRVFAWFDARDCDGAAILAPDTQVQTVCSAGTFTRFLAQYVRDRKLISWSDAIAKISYLPAKLLEETAPQMMKKGWLQVGMERGHHCFRPGVSAGPSNV